MHYAAIFSPSLQAPTALSCMSTQNSPRMPKTNFSFGKKTPQPPNNHVWNKTSLLTPPRTWSTREQNAKKLQLAS